MIARIAVLATVCILTTGCMVPPSDTPPRLNLDQQMRIACRASTGTLRILTPLKSRMSQDEVRAVDIAVDIIQPTCHDAEAGKVTLAAGLARVQGALNTLVITESKVTP